MEDRRIIYVGTNDPAFSFSYEKLEILNDEVFDKGAFYIFETSLLNNEIIQLYELKEFKDYVFSDIFLKKIIVMYGNCHLAPIIQQLRQQKSFSHQYFIYPILPICLIKDPNYFDEPIFKHFCNIFIHQQIRDENIYGPQYSSKSIISKLPKHCKTCSIPNLYRLPLFMFPQNSVNSGLFYKGDKVFSFDSILDGWVLKHIRVMPEKEYIRVFHKLINTTKSNTLGPEMFFSKIKTREEKWDIKISDFIKENFDKPLFYDPNHPSELIINYISSCLCSLLNIQYTKCTSAILDALEMPSIYNYKQDKLVIRAHSFVLNRNGLSLKQYISLYIFCNFENRNIKSKLKRHYLRQRLVIRLFLYRIMNYIINHFKIKSI